MPTEPTPERRRDLLREMTQQAIEAGTYGEPAPEMRPTPERTPQDDTTRLTIDDLTGPAMREMFREMDDAYQAASAAFAADDMEAWVEHAGRGAELFEKFARLNGWRDGERS